MNLNEHDRGFTLLKVKSSFFQKKKKHLWKLCCGSAMSQLIHGNIIHSIKILGVDSICVNQGKHQSKQD